MSESVFHVPVPTESDDALISVEELVSNGLNNIYEATLGQFSVDNATVEMVDAYREGAGLPEQHDGDLTLAFSEYAVENWNHPLLVAQNLVNAPQHTFKNSDGDLFYYSPDGEGREVESNKDLTQEEEGSKCFLFNSGEEKEPELIGNNPDLAPPPEEDGIPYADTNANKWIEESDNIAPVMTSIVNQLIASGITEDSIEYYDSLINVMANNDIDLNAKSDFLDRFFDVYGNYIGEEKALGILFQYEVDWNTIYDETYMDTLMTVDQDLLSISANNINPNDASSFFVSKIIGDKLFSGGVFPAQYFEMQINDSEALNVELIDTISSQAHINPDLINLLIKKLEENDVYDSPKFGDGKMVISRIDDPNFGDGLATIDDRPMTMFYDSQFIPKSPEELRQLIEDENPGMLDTSHQKIMEAYYTDQQPIEYSPYALSSVPISFLPTNGTAQEQQAFLASRMTNIAGISTELAQIFIAGHEEDGSFNREVYANSFGYGTSFAMLGYSYEQYINFVENEIGEVGGVTYQIFNIFENEEEYNAYGRQLEEVGPVLINGNR